MNELLIDNAENEFYFEDGESIIDYVLVYTKKNNSNLEHMTKAAKIRQNFINFLTKEHKIQVREKIIKTDRMEIGFYLLHLPWQVLIDEAEKLKLKVPLKELKAGLKIEVKMIEKFSFFNYFSHNLPLIEENHQSEIFKKEHLQKFDKKANFRNSQRQYVIKEILDSVVYRQESIESKLSKFWSRFKAYNRNSNIRLTRLLKENILHSAFPLHEGIIDFTRFKFKQKKNLNKKVDRQLLYDHWASWACLFKFQPLNDIEKYFGTKVAFFFAWLGFFTTWLLPIALLGLIFFFLGNFDPSYEDSNNLICGDKADHIIMCPLCDECTPWHLSDICMTSKLNRMFDNIFTVFFSLIINLWAVFFLEFWKRKSKNLSYSWSVLDYERDEEKPRPDYCFHATKQHHNPITQKLEPYFPKYVSFCRQLIGTLVLAGFIFLSICSHSVIILLRLSLHHFMFLTEGLRPFATLISNIAAGVINLIFIISINYLYEKLAKKITNWEMFRTQTEFEESLILKLFIMLSFNYYSHAFYIAFLKGKSKLTINGTSYSETCSHTGCHIEVAFYLFITFGAKQVLKVCYEIAYPRFKKFSNIIKSGLPYVINQWESDYQLNELTDLVNNYLYFVIQFGFVTLFVSVFPLGAFFAFCFNLVAIRVNAQKILCESKRMVIVRANGIGIWFKILETISNISVLSNALIIAFSSDFIDKLVYYLQNGTINGFTEANLVYSKLISTNVTCRYFEYKGSNKIYINQVQSSHYYKIICYKLIFVVVYQNLVSWVQKYIEVSVSDIPRNLDIKIKKEKTIK